MNYAILINQENKIKSNYLKKINLIATEDQNKDTVLVEEETLKAFNELQKFLKTKGINIVIDSAYRSIVDQENLYNESITKYGEEYTTKYVAKPNYSEHHTGLALDLSIIVNGQIQDATTHPEIYNKIYETIHSYLKDFGFILRYPKGKENITGYAYEPWHIRYVGKFIAKIIFENNYTLEEYLTNYNGVLIINKPKGLTSFDVVNTVSSLFGIKRVGHTGTLDPLAEGVLVVTIGKATKIAELLTSTYKEYLAEAKLGIETDTGDITGKILNTKKTPLNIEVEPVLNSFQKTYYQEVPIYSAVKVNGKKLYNYARENKKVELPKKEVTIKEIKLLSKTNDTFTFKCTVSKGCYIRSLIKDIGTALNTYATMSALIRTKQGKFSLEQASTLEDLKQANYQLYKIEEVLDYPTIKVDDKLGKRIQNGQKISNDFNIKDKVIFLTEEGKLLGIYEAVDNFLRTWKNF
ncbi:MAG: tRNA pseudouridine(55) synthase TruB [bacterium]|nr:tRNA pseudouridine(55) synthase TruB [bacterium]